MKKTLLSYLGAGILASVAYSAHAQSNYEIIGRDTVRVENILRLERDTIKKRSYDHNGNFKDIKIIDTDASYYKDNKLVGAALRHSFSREYGNFDNENIVRTVRKN